MIRPQPTDPLGPGATGFPLSYWKTYYAEPEKMDGVFNARRQALALKALLDAHYVDVGRLIDFGFGLGHLFRAMVDVLVPFEAVGVEPSPHAFGLLERDAANGAITDVESIRIELLRTDLRSWCDDPAQEAVFDLGICTSVFQYLSDPEIEAVMPVLARRLKYLYFTAPTEEELRWQTDTLDFDDRYAIPRTRDAYYALLRPHFAIVGHRLLESRSWFNDDTTFFVDLLFRY